MVKTERRTLTWEDLPRRARNAANTRVALFECARVYHPSKEVLPRELEHVVGAVTGSRLDRFGNTTDALVDFWSPLQCFSIHHSASRLCDRDGSPNMFLPGWLGDSTSA